MPLAVYLAGMYVEGKGNIVESVVFWGFVGKIFINFALKLKVGQGCPA